MYITAGGGVFGHQSPRFCVYGVWTIHHLDTFSEVVIGLLVQLETASTVAIKLFCGIQRGKNA